MQGLRNELPVERENAGLRNELDPFWAWKWESPEHARTRLANPRRCRTLCVRAEQAVWGDERVEIQILKMMVSIAKSAINVKWWCSGPDFFGNLWKLYAPEIQGWKFSHAAHTQYIAYIMEVPPPPQHGCGPSWSWDAHYIDAEKKMPTKLIICHFSWHTNWSVKKKKKKKKFRKGAQRSHNAPFWRKTRAPTTYRSPF